jgi:hypothetical protein
VCVFITAGPSTKLFAWGGGGGVIWEDMCYERRQAEACVDGTIICTRLVYRGLLITKSKRFMDQSASDMMNVKLYTVGRR